MIKLYIDVCWLNNLILNILEMVGRLMILVRGFMYIIVKNCVN